MVFTSACRPFAGMGRNSVSDEFVNRQFLPNQATRKIGITPVHTHDPRQRCQHIAKNTFQRGIGETKPATNSAR